MGWSIGWDSNWQRDIGYGVPCKCDHPGCNKHIHRGLSFVCGGEPYGGEHGCGLYFCSKHLQMGVEGPLNEHGEEGEPIHTQQVCERCAKAEPDPPFEPKPDTRTWLRHKLTHSSWKPWRDENPKEVEAIKLALVKVPVKNVEAA